MTRSIITIGLFLTTFSGFGQNLEFDIHENKLADFIQIEERLVSEKMEIKGNHISPKGVTQPLIYKRKETLLPDLVVYYFYLKKDSTIYYVLYEWKEQDFVNHHLDSIPKTIEQINGFITKYKEVYGQIAKAYGESKVEGSVEDLSNIETEAVKRTDEWKPDDSTEIKLSIYLSNKYEKFKYMTSFPSYVIRLYVNNKAPNPDAVLKPEGKKLDSLDAMFKKFIIELRDSHLDSARECMSDLIKNTITNEQLGEVAKAIHFNDSLVINLTGIQMGPDGTGYPMLKYRYRTDNDYIANELITVIFDKDNKILGVQPMKRQ